MRTLRWVVLGIILWTFRLDLDGYRAWAIDTTPMPTTSPSTTTTNAPTSTIPLAPPVTNNPSIVRDVYTPWIWTTVDRQVTAFPSIGSTLSGTALVPGLPTESNVYACISPIWSRLRSNDWEWFLVCQTQLSYPLWLANTTQETEGELLDSTGMNWQAGSNDLASETIAWSWMYRNGRVLVPTLTPKFPSTRWKYGTPGYILYRMRPPCSVAKGNVLDSESQCTAIGSLNANTRQMTITKTSLDASDALQRTWIFYTQKLPDPLIGISASANLWQLDLDANMASTPIYRCVQIVESVWGGAQESSLVLSSTLVNEATCSEIRAAGLDCTWSQPSVAATLPRTARVSMTCQSYHGGVQALGKDKVDCSDNEPLLRMSAHCNTSYWYQPYDASGAQRATPTGTGAAPTYTCDFQCRFPCVHQTSQGWIHPTRRTVCSVDPNTYIASKTMESVCSARRANQVPLGGASLERPATSFCDWGETLEAFTPRSGYRCRSDCDPACVGRVDLDWECSCSGPRGCPNHRFCSFQGTFYEHDRSYRMQRLPLIESGTPSTENAWAWLQQYWGGSHAVAPDEIASQCQCNPGYVGSKCETLLAQGQRCHFGQKL